MDTLARCLRIPASGSTQSPPEVTKLFADSRASFPLGFSHAHSYVRPRAALIG